MYFRVDVAKLYLAQQILLIWMACLCNPIIINTFVVFVRLYWFEKRFQGIAGMAAAPVVHPVDVTITKDRLITTAIALPELVVVHHDLFGQGSMELESNI